MGETPREGSSESVLDSVLTWFAMWVHAHRRVCEGRLVRVRPGYAVRAPSRASSEERRRRSRQRCNDRNPVMFGTPHPREWWRCARKVHAAVSFDEVEAGSGSRQGGVARYRAVRWSLWPQDAQGEVSPGTCARETTCV